MVRNKLFNNIYFGKKVLITGHTGFKGSWLALWLKSMGAEVCGYSLEANTNPSHWNMLKLDMKSVIADIRDIETLNYTLQEFKPEIVFHLAAQPIVRLSYSDPVETYSVNVMGSLNVLEACRKVPDIKAIVCITSDKCYDNKEWVWGYREDDPMGGYDPYSSSKGCTELLVASYRNSYFNPETYNIDHNVLLATTRAGNVIGGGDWAVDRLIPDTIVAASMDQKVKIRNPHATRPWQHVLEPLSGYLLLGQKLLEGNKEFAEAWNFGPNPTGVLTVKQLLDRIKEYWGSIDIEFDKDDHPHEAGLLKLDCSKAYQLLNWQENLDINDTIFYTIKWYKEFYISNKVYSMEQLQEYIEKAIANKIVWTGKN